MAGKYAFLVNSGTDEIGPTANGIEYALDLNEAGNDVALYLDGSATQWVGELRDNPDHPVNEYYEAAQEDGVLAGVCGYCADSFGAYEDAEEAGIETVGGRDQHGPDISELVDDGYELITIG